MPTATEATATDTSNDLEPMLDLVFGQSKASIVEPRTHLEMLPLPKRIGKWFSKKD